jgi:hypothetical protein
MQQWLARGHKQRLRSLAMTLRWMRDATDRTTDASCRLAAGGNQTWPVVLTFAKRHISVSEPRCS